MDYSLTDSSCRLPVLERLGQNCWEQPNNAGNTGFCRMYCMDCFEGTDLYILWREGEMFFMRGGCLFVYTMTLLIY